MRLIDADALEEKLDKIPARRIENADGRAYVLIRLSTVFEIIKQMPPAQPEEAIPVSWIESRIERFMTMDNAFGGLTASIMLVMLNEWKREQEGETT